MAVDQAVECELESTGLELYFLKFGIPPPFDDQILLVFKSFLQLERCHLGQLERFLARSALWKLSTSMALYG
ncbi:hypothetical protein [Microbulbifer halophilus]|uniref:Transposase InsH N-terminal domain-containing protein n=1 Tax=Microbulbifer halophilus TaxID=453963 RepID=A0ABW5E7R5_9GAMM|nr:hypothetical protein [Microbulbifer halophilus]MCW8126731.1 hypothetical protein [Microbulbifer halophilus]